MRFNSPCPASPALCTPPYLHAAPSPSHSPISAHMQTHSATLTRLSTQPPMNPTVHRGSFTLHHGGASITPAARTPICMQMHVQTHTATHTATCTQHQAQIQGLPCFLLPHPSPSSGRAAGLPEEEQADVCSATICVLLDPIIISITPSTHPWSSANWDGWSLLPVNRGAGVPRRGAGDAKHCQQMGCHGEWVAEGTGRAWG